MYVSKYGNDLLSSRTVVLRLPDGAEWKMGLSRSGGRVWLKNGWQEFARNYCLSCGTFMVFRYAGTCCFEVVIFDLSCTEIEYPRLHNAGGCSRTHGESHEQVDVDEEGEGECWSDDDASVQIMDVASDDDNAGDETGSSCSLHI